MARAASPLNGRISVICSSKSRRRSGFASTKVSCLVESAFIVKLPRDISGAGAVWTFQQPVKTVPDNGLAPGEKRTETFSSSVPAE